MADPLTIFAAAGNALQFAELVVKVVRKTVEYSTNGGSSEHQELQGVVQRLLSTSENIHVNVGQSSRAVPPGPTRALHAANEECIRISREAYDLLEELKLNRYGNLWRSIKLSLSNLRKNRRIEQLTDRINDARSNLMLALMVTIESETSESKENMAKNHHELMRVLNSVTGRATDIRSDINDLASKLSKLDFQDQTVDDQWKKTIARHTQWLERVAIKLEKYLEQSNDNIKNPMSQVEALAHSMDLDLQTRHRIQNSLYLTTMHERRNHVARAYEHTYHWVFEPHQLQGESQCIWDSYFDWLCQDETNRIYWIYGKPGSGKTTLMRELDERIPVSSHHEDWSPDHSSYTIGHEVRDQFSEAVHGWIGRGQLYKVSCYFWSAGSIEQKSLSGLLRSIAYQLLEQRPDLIERAVHKRRWDHAMIPAMVLPLWNDTELVDLIQKFPSLIDEHDKILLFIDGLDELEGPESYRDQLVDIIKQITQIQSIKACIASRPWNIFLDAFDQCPQIRLEDLTKGDIRSFVHQKLLRNMWFQRQHRLSPELLDSISTAINDKAQGVFLWVVLAVRDMLRILRDGGKGVDMFRELDRIPPELEDYFRRIMDTIDPRYREEAAIIIQTALCSLDYEVDDSEVMVSGPSLRLFDLEHTDEARNPAFALAIDSDLTSARTTPQEVDEFCNSLIRKLSSRTMGLLEPSGTSGMDPTETLDKHCGIRIEFLHRTVRDFLIKPLAQRILLDYLGEPFDAHIFRCNLLVVEMAAHCMHEEPIIAYSLVVGTFLRNVQARDDHGEPEFALYEKFLELTQRFEQTIPPGKFYTLSSDGSPVHSLIELERHSETAIHMAIRLGWYDYCKARLTPKLLSDAKDQPFLQCALISSRVMSMEKPTEPRIVQLLLDMGADPDQSAAPSFEGPFWAQFVDCAFEARNFGLTVVQDTMALLLASGIETRCQLSAMAAVKRFERIFRHRAALLTKSTASAVTHELVDLDPIEMIEHYSSVMSEERKDPIVVPSDLARFKTVYEKGRSSKAKSDTRKRAWAEVDVQYGGGDLSQESKRPKLLRAPFKSMVSIHRSVFGPVSTKGDAELGYANIQMRWGSKIIYTSGTIELRI